MKTILFSSRDFCNEVVKCSTQSELILKSTLLGFEEIDLDEVRQKAEIGSFITTRYFKNIVPFQIVNRNEDGTLDLLSHFALAFNIFNQNGKKNSNWDSSFLRKYMNGKFTTRFDPEFLAELKKVDVKTRNFNCSCETKDRFRVPSYEELQHFGENLNWTKDEISRRGVNQTPCHWWLRNIPTGDVYNAMVDTMGNIISTIYHTEIKGIIPLCTI